MKSTVGLFTLAVAMSCLLQKGRAQGVIEIQPAEGNITLAEGNEFRRLCIAHTNVDVTIHWMHNGDTIKSKLGRNLQLLLPSIVSSDAGEYFCQIVFTNGTTVGPISGGVLTVIGINVIDAPSDQYAIIGTNYTLECSIPYDNVFTSWMVNGGYSTGVIVNAAFSDEGTYTCSLFLSEFALRLEKDVQLHIFVPVVIVPGSSSPTYREIQGNPSHQITVAFQGGSDTIVTWYKDGTELEQDEFETEFTGEAEGMTYISFDPVTRSDMGVYRVMLESPLDNDVIATHLRRAEATFQIDVIVPPVKPTDLEVNSPLGTRAQITWSLANQIADEAADSLTLTLESPNDIPIFQEYTLPGSQTALDVDVVPGLQYIVRLSSHNVDGITFADPLTVDTPPMPPLVIQDSIEIVRINRTAFHLNISLNHTGGGNVVITALYRERGTIEWLSVDSVTLLSVSASLTSYEVVLDIRNLPDNGPLEFEITLTNARELVMTADVVGETLVPPGAPTDILLTSSTSNALNIEVHLSPEGTPPITEVRLELTSPRISANTSSETGFFLPGDAIEFVIKDLQIETDYSFIAYSVNFAGIGSMSEEKSFQTAALSVDESENENEDSFFLIIVVVAICGTMVILAVVVALVCCMVLCFKHHHRKHRYPINGKKPQPQKDVRRNRLNSSNEMLNRLDTDIARADVLLKIKAQDSPSSLKQNGIISHTDLSTGQNTPTTTTEDSPSNVKRRMEVNGSSTVLLPANGMESQGGSTSRMPCMPPSHRSSIISTTDSNVYVPYPTKHASISTTTTELPFSPNYGEPMESADVYPLGPFLPRGSIGASSQSNTSIPLVAPYIQRGSRSNTPILPTHSSQHLLLNHSHRGSIESTPMMMYRMEHQGSVSSTSSSTASSRERIQRSVMTSVPRETQSLQSLAHRSGYNSINSTLESIPQVPPNLLSSQYISDV